MRLRTALVIVVMLWTGSATRGQGSAIDRTPDRVDRLRQWLDAVEQHEPGAADDALLRVASWDRMTLWRVWIDVGTVVSLIRDPKALVFYAPIEPEPFSGVYARAGSSFTEIAGHSYGWNDVKRLQAIAKDVVDRGGENRMLISAASLHADIVMLEAGQSLAPDPSRRPRSSQVMVFLADGQQTGIDDAGVHWEMGRRLLDKVRPKNARRLGPDPGADETVRLWYLASSAYMQAVEQLDGWHFERAVQLFPRDPETLFLAACAREMFSGPQIQNVLASTTLSRDLFNLIGDEGDELGKAERLFRQSLELDPKQTEARIRLGRVLGRRGRHQDAIVELRRATMETKNRLLQYLRADVPRCGGGGARSRGRVETRLRTRRRIVSGCPVAASRHWRARGPHGRPCRRVVGDPTRADWRRSAAVGRSLVELLHVSGSRPCWHRGGPARSSAEGAAMKAALAVAISAAAVVTGSAQQPTFSSRVDAVRVDVLVKDRGQIVRGLRPQDFEVRDEGVLQEVDLVRLEQIPLNVILGLDVSESVAGERLEHLLGAGNTLLARLAGDDRAALLTFSHAVRLRQELTRDITRVRQALEDVIPAGQTSLVDGASAAIALSGSDVGRSLLILFSDGVDTSSFLSPDVVLQSAPACRRRRVPVSRCGAESARRS